MSSDGHDASTHGRVEPHGHGGTCPSCGAALVFAVGHSRVAVCKYCNSLVARAGQNLALVGKVADLVPTGSRIALGARGALVGDPFTVVGRLQLQWSQGVWDEWYVAFQSGRWGWLAEAQGRYYLTFLMPERPVPPRDHARPGVSVDFREGGVYTITDVKEARIVACEGELPDVVAIGDAPRTADLEGPSGAFATIDYGGPGDAPQIFAGRQMTLVDLALHGSASAHPSGPEGQAMGCANCGAPLTRRVPDQSVRIACGSCGAILDTSKGSLAIIEVLGRLQHEPPIPLGTTGHLLGEDRMVVGYMRRGCVVSGVHYPWEELLLYQPKTTAFSWLILSDGHWSFAEAISAAEVHEGYQGADFKGQRYRSFSKTVGVVEHVLGEFYWEVRARDEAHLEDYVAPPSGLSVERTAAEISWSRTQHLEPLEVANAFAMPGLAKRWRKGVGMLQPWPLDSARRSLLIWSLGALMAAFGLVIIFMSMPSEVIVEHTFAMSEVTAVDGGAEDPADLPPGGKVLSFLSPPFDLHGNKAIDVSVQADVANSWAYVEGGLIHADSGEAAVFGLETAYYSGYEDGESWSEGSTSASQTLTAPPAGSYVVRADLEWDPGRAKPPTVTLKVTEGTASGGQFVAAFLALMVGLLFFLHRRRFEAARWEESNV